MRRLLLALPASAALLAAACSSGTSPTPVAPRLSGGWELEQNTSRLSFVTIKAGQVVEAHHFTTLSGSVGSDGKATFSIDLASVKTDVDIRDTRMRDVLFDVARFPEATATTRIDPAGLADLGVGEQTILPVQVTLSLHGEIAPVVANLAVTRIATDKVEVATTKPIVIDADNFSLVEGIGKLQELAGLPSITSEVPVTFSLIFDKKTP